MKRISIIKRIAQVIKNKITYKERFLHACIYSFYVQAKRIELANGVAFLPFYNEQQARDYAKLKADELIEEFKKENTINERYKLALNWAKPATNTRG